jgi:hypothetical protein
MQSRADYVVDTDRLSPTERVDVVRAVIERLASDDATYECDIPLSEEGAWPPVVREAASVLGELKYPKMPDASSYRQTGVQERDDATVWRAFVTFAPYAYDASVWSATGRPLVELADEGRSVVVRLTEEEARSLAEDLRVPVVALRRWRRSGR